MLQNIKKIYDNLKTRSSLYAQFVPIANVEGSRFLSDVYESMNFGSYLNAAFQLAIVAGGMLAVLRLVYGGFVYMTTDASSRKEDAKKIIFNAVLGLLILLGIVIVLEYINPNLLNLDIGASTQQVQQ